MKETVAALRLLWEGRAVSVDGQYVHLSQAACTPAPLVSPRVVVGAGASRRLASQAVEYADELNVYAEPAVVEHALAAVEASGRVVPVSTYCHYAWDAWPSDLAGDLRQWREMGVSRCMVTIGFGWDLVERAHQVADAQQALV